MDNDLTLEQYLSPLSPLIAGFRLDAFSAIKPRVTHSPLPDAYTKDALSLMDERYISPAVLHIQVSALQVPLKLPFHTLDVHFVLHFMWHASVSFVL